MATKPDDDFEFEIEDTEVEVVDDTPEIEVVDDTPEIDRNRAPMPQAIVDEIEADELEEYSDKVKVRLKQMKKVWHDERREKEKLQREQAESISLSQRLLNENRQLKDTLSQGEHTLIQSFQNSAEHERAQAQREFKEAYEAGDSDKLIGAQEKLQDTNYRLSQLKSYKPSIQEEFNEVSSPQEQVHIPRPDQKTMAWQERNPWYGDDEEMTATALGLHQKLIKQNGVEYAGTDEYWRTIDKTMARRFPENFGEDTAANGSDKPAARGSRSANVVAPASRSTSSRKIVLKQSQISIAKRLGITPEQYAREVAKLES